MHFILLFSEVDVKVQRNMLIRSLGVEVVRMQFGVWLMGRQDRMKSEGIKAGSAAFSRYVSQMERVVLRCIT